MSPEPSLADRGSAAYEPVTEDLCHANAGSGDCYWPERPGSVPMYFRCPDRIVDPVIDFPCTGSKHLPGGVQVICSCECHTKPPTAGVIGQYVPMSGTHRPLAWRTWPNAE